MNLDRLYAELDYVWVCWLNAKLVKKWKVANPGEARLLDQWIDARTWGTVYPLDPPNLLTPTGQALLGTFNTLQEIREELRNRQGGGDESGGSS